MNVIYRRQSPLELTYFVHAFDPYLTVGRVEWFNNKKDNIPATNDKALDSNVDKIRGK
jgi:hypothetical protein